MALRGQEHSTARSRGRRQQAWGVERAAVSGSPACGREMSTPKSPKGNAKQGPSGAIRVPFQGGGPTTTFAFWVFPRSLGGSTSGGRYNPAANPVAHLVTRMCLPLPGVGEEQLGHLGTPAPSPAKFCPKQPASAQENLDQPTARLALPCLEKWFDSCKASPISCLPAPLLHFPD